MSEVLSPASAPLSGAQLVARDSAEAAATSAAAAGTAAEPPPPPQRTFTLTLTWWDSYKHSGATGTLLRYLCESGALPALDSFETTTITADDSDDSEEGCVGIPPLTTAGVHASVRRRNVLLQPSPGCHPFRQRGEAWELRLSEDRREHFPVSGQYYLAHPIVARLALPAVDAREAGSKLAQLLLDASAWLDARAGDAARTIKVVAHSGGGRGGGSGGEAGSGVEKRKARRALETVFLPAELKSRVVEELRAFLADKDAYARFGVPYRRSFLLTGPPGQGKTSLIHALASEFDKQLHVLQFTPDLDDAALTALIAAVPRGAFCVVEDVDALFPAATRDRTDASKHALSFSGLLNALDGLVAPQNYVLFMTTNHEERLDPALLRPGRVDTVLQFAHVRPEQVREMWAAMLPAAPAHAADAFLRAMRASRACEQCSAAIVHRYIFDHRRDASGAHALADFAELEKRAAWYKRRVAEKIAPAEAMFA